MRTHAVRPNKNQLKSLPTVGLSHRGSRNDTYVIVKCGRHNVTSLQKPIEIIAARRAVAPRQPR